MSLDAALCFTRACGWHLVAPPELTTHYSPPVMSPTRGTAPMAHPKQHLEVLHRFAFHPATETTGPQHDKTREKHALMASWVLKNVPVGRHQSLALTALQESMMWCNAAIACDTPDDEG